MNCLVLTQYHDVFIHPFLNNKFINTIYRFNYSLADTIYYNHIYKKYNINYINYKLNYSSYSRCINSDVELLFYSSIDFIRFTKSNQKITKRLLQKYTSFYNQVDRFFQDYEIDIIFTWNGMNILDLIVLNLAKKYKIKYIIYEMGLFRPNTLTIDSKKVNYGNSVPKNIMFYKTNNFTKKFQIPKKINNNESKYGYLIYKVFDHFLFFLNIKTYKRFDNTYKKLNIFRKKNIDYVDVSSIKKDVLNIFIPLQVSYDTQILINSPYIKTMDTFIDILLKSLPFLEKKFSKKVCLYVKEHPKEEISLTGYKQHRFIKFLNPEISSKDVINSTNIVMTINSTVGLEAIELNKPVIVFGNAFYAIPPIAYSIKELGQLPDIVFEAYSSTDFDLQNKFIQYLKYEYQLPYNPNNIMQYDNHLHKKRINEIFNK